MKPNINPTILALIFSLVVVENSGIEPLTSCVQSRRSPSWANSPSSVMVGLPGLEPGTSPLSGVHSNQLSYRPSCMRDAHYDVKYLSSITEN